MAGDKKFGVQVVVSAVDNISAQFKQINKNIANSPLTKLNNSVRRLGTNIGINQLGKAMSNVGRAASDVVGETTALATKLAALGGLGGAGLFGLAKNFAEFGDAVNDGAEALGISTSQFQEWSGAFKIAGIDTDTFRMSVGRLSKGFGEAAAGSGEALVAFQAMGIQIRDKATGQLRSLSVVLPEVVQKLNSIKDASFRNAVGAKLFGKQFQQLVPAIIDFNKNTAKARKLIFSPEEIKRGDAFIDQFNELKMTINKVLMLAGSGLIDGFSKAFEIIGQAVMDNKDGIKDFFKIIGDSLPSIAQSLVDAGKAFKEFFTQTDSTGKTTLNFSRLKLVLAAIAAVMTGPLILSVANLVGSVFTLGQVAFGVFSKILLFATGTETVMAGLGAVFTSIGSVIASGWGIVVGMFEGLAAVLGISVGWVVILVGALVGAGVLLYKKWEPFRNLIDGIWDKLKSFGSFALSGIKDAFGITSTTSAIQQAPALAGGAVQTINNNMTQKQEVGIKVDLNGLPRGSRVTTSNPDYVPLDLSRGYTNLSF